MKSIIKNQPGTIKRIKGTPYDDVFHTLLKKCRKLIIPVINEVFKTNYSMDEKVVLLSNEHYTVDENSEDVIRITDSCVKIRHRLYHIECESRTKSGMEIRMIEYDFHIALSNKSQEDGRYVIRFPESAVMYLRNTKNTPDELKVKMIMPDGAEVPYGIPTLKVQRYSKEEIFDNNLLFFIPYYILKFENELEKIDNTPERLREFVADYEDIYDRLCRLEEKKLIDYAYLKDLVGLTTKLMNVVAGKCDNIRREVTIMNGRILETPGDKIREEIAKGKVEELRNTIFYFLSEHGEISDSLNNTIIEQYDLSTLRKWIKLAAKVSSIEEFEKEMYIVKKLN